MSKKLVFALVLMSLILLCTTPLASSQDQPAPSELEGWQVETTGDSEGGYCSYSNGVFRLWSNGGGTTCVPTIALYKAVNVTGDFTFSAEVNAQTLNFGALFLRGSLPIAGSTDGCNFEFGYYGQEVFELSRNCSKWTPYVIGYGYPHEWYTMQLNVSSSPFQVTASVFDQNDNLIASYSTNYITGFSFDDVHYIGFVVWGPSPADYSFRNIQDSFDNQATLSINTQSSATTAGATIDVLGTLLDASGLPLANKTIVLSYEVSSMKSWVPIGSAQTDRQGNYLIQWVNSASGTFALKTQWSQNPYVSNATTLSLLPAEDKSTFVIESNSTLSTLAFDNSTSILSFNVAGPSGTKGYVKATFAKSLLADGTALQAYLDGHPINYVVTSSADSWIYTFTYSHSTHKVSMHLGANTYPTQPIQASAKTQPQGNELLLITLIIVFVIVLTAGVISLLRFKRNINNARDAAIS